MLFLLRFIILHGYLFFLLYDLLYAFKVPLKVFEDIVPDFHFLKRFSVPQDLSHDIIHILGVVFLADIEVLEDLLEVAGCGESEFAFGDLAFDLFYTRFVFLKELGDLQISRKNRSYSLNLKVKLFLLLHGIKLIVVQTCFEYTFDHVKIRFSCNIKLDLVFIIILNKESC